MVMENFGIGSVQASPEKSRQDSEVKQVNPKDNKEKKKMKFELLTPEALSIFYNIAKFAQEHDLKDLFSEYSYEQVVKTKTKENVVEIIDSEHFISLLEEVGLV